MPEAGSKKAHLPLPLKKDSLSTESARDAIEEEEVPLVQKDEEDELEGVGTPIDRLFQLNANQLATCKFDGATPEIIEAERVGFISHHLENGSFSHDWDASWAKWWKRWKDYVAKQAEKSERIAKRERDKEATLPARVEVNNVIDWEKHITFWLKTGRGSWPRSGIGPDPDHEACKCPLEILIKHKLRKENA